MLVRELVIRYDCRRRPSPKQLRTPKDCAAHLTELIGHEAVEVLVLLCLDAQHQLICWHELSRGTVNQTSLHPRDVYKAAFLANAVSVILGHNHPSGVLSPSPEDLALTRRLRELSELVGIPLLDHIVVSGDGRYFSIREMGGL